MGGGNVGAIVKWVFSNMYDFSFFRNNLDAVAERLAARGFALDVDAFRALDAGRRTALTESESLQARRKSESQQIGKLKASGADTEELQAKVRAMGDRVAELEKKAAELDEQFRELLAGIPNLPHESVPSGRSSEDNIVVRGGEPPTGRSDAASSS